VTSSSWCLLEQFKLSRESHPHESGVGLLKHSPLILVE
jgi:hypothetical protein